MKNLNSLYPKSLTKERELVETKCDLLIEAFNQLCNEEEKKVREERKQKLAARIFRYSILPIADGWRVLFKTSEQAVDPETDTQWSKPFKIINGVLIHSEHAWEGTSWGSANARIPQGLFDESKLEEINKDW